MCEVIVPWLRKSAGGGLFKHGNKTQKAFTNSRTHLKLVKEEAMMSGCVPGEPCN